MCFDYSADIAVATWQNIFWETHEKSSHGFNATTVLLIAWFTQETCCVCPITSGLELQGMLSWCSSVMIYRLHALHTLLQLFCKSVLNWL